MHPHFEIRTIEAVPTLTIRTTVPIERIGETFGPLLQEVWAHARQVGAAVAGPPFALYHRVSEAGADLEAGVPVATPAPGGGRVRAGMRPAGRVACATHYGPYETLEKTYEALQAWAEEQGHTLATVMWESYETDPEEEPDPSRWRTDVYWPLRE